MPLPPVTKQKTPAYIREIQVYKCWTKVYSRKGLTAMLPHRMGSYTLSTEDLFPFLESACKELILAEDSPHVTKQHITF